MITFKKFGKTIKIRNDDWKKLKERFDADKAEWDDIGQSYKILLDCSLCDRYTCIDCPLAEFGHGYKFGCTDFFNLLFKPMNLLLGRNGITWSKQANKKARSQLCKLQKMMDKIEASQ